MEIKVTLTYQQWNILTDLLEDKRDSWARIVAGAVVENRANESIDSYASKYAELDGLYAAVMNDSETN